MVKKQQQEQKHGNLIHTQSDKGLMLPLYIGHCCHLCMEGQIILNLQSLSFKRVVQLEVVNENVSHNHVFCFEHFPDHVYCLFS